MIKATGYTSDNMPLLIIGLSGESMTRLMADEPIRIDTANLGLPRMSILIVGGRTEDAIATNLRKAFPSIKEVTQ
jgi:hypothetical protein